MINKIKDELKQDPERIRAVLEHYDYANIIIHKNYISFGRDESSSPKSIVIRLDKDGLRVTDYPKNLYQDFFSYIIEQRGVTFKDVLSTVKSALGITDYYGYFEKKRTIFGGFYSSLKSKKADALRTYDESVLDQYSPCANARFLRDNISIETQKYFGIRYDVENQGIVIPIRDTVGNLIGIKERINREPEDNEQKYWYVLPCRMSCTLYGYYQNYNHMTDGTILICEAEKSVMQCFSYGIHNAVALGSGTISLNQVKWIMSLNPKKIIFLHDVGYEYEAIMRNIKMIQKYSIFSEIKLGFWDWEKYGYTGKDSPTDFGKDKLNDILKNEITYLEVEEDEI